MVLLPTLLLSPQSLPLTPWPDMLRLRLSMVAQPAMIHRLPRLDLSQVRESGVMTLAQCDVRTVSRHQGVDPDRAPPEE